MPTKTTSSSALKLQRAQMKKNAKGESQYLRCIRGKIFPERNLSRRQEAVCRQVVLKAIRSIGKRPSDFRPEALREMKGIVRNVHPSRRMDSSAEGKMHYATLGTFIKDPRLFDELFKELLDGSIKAFWPKKVIKNAGFFSK